MDTEYKLIHPAKHFRDFVNNNLREDGRHFNNFRPIAIKNEPIFCSLGSSFTKIGNSKVMCGIRAELAKPKTLTPDCGYIIPTIDLNFVLSSLKTNSSQEIADTLSCLICNIIVDSECIKLKDLCIKKKEFVWALYIDLVFLELDGGILDASLLASTSALINTFLPEVFIGEAGNISCGLNKKKLPFYANALSSSNALFQNVILSDPTYEEECISEAMLHAIVFGNQFGSVFKSGGKPVKKEKMDNSITNVLKQEHDINDLFKKLLERKPLIKSQF